MGVVVDGDPDPGGANGAAPVVLLNEFPSLLKLGMLSNLSGIGPLNRLFATFL